MEDDGAEPCAVSTVSRAQAATHGLSDLRYLQPASGSNSFLRPSQAAGRGWPVIRGKEER